MAHFYRDTRVISLALGLVLSAGCARAPTDTGASGKEAAPQGYFRIKGHTCYAPPDFTTMGRSEAQSTRLTAYDQAKRRWAGEVEPAFKLSDRQLSELEAVYLNRPEDLGPMLAIDLTLCQQWANGNLDLDTYGTELVAQSRAVGKGRCEPTAFTLISNHLLVDKSWQVEIPLCKDQRVVVSLSNARYSITYSDQVPTEQVRWISADGDPDSTNLDGAPCQSQGCKPGMVVGRFVPQVGDPIIFPVGKSLTYTAPAHGDLSFRINDDSFYDNRFFQEKQVFDFLVIEVRPAL